jgi:hypothetical protein
VTTGTVSALKSAGVVGGGQFFFVSRLVSPYPGQSEHNGENMRFLRDVVLMSLLQEKISIASQTNGSPNQYLLWSWMVAMNDGTDGHSKRYANLDSGYK